MYPLGAKLNKPDARDILFASLYPDQPLPTVFSRRKEQSPVRLQIYGSCIGFTGKDVAEAQNLRNGGAYYELSGRAAYALCKSLDGNTEQGTDLRSLMRVQLGVGIPYEIDFPNDSKLSYTDYINIGTLSEEARQNADKNSIIGFVIIRTLQELKQAIFNKGEVPIVIPVYADYLSSQNGVINQPTGNIIGLHAVSAIGWNDDKGLEIKNHWGTGWGDNGFAFLPYTYGNQLCFLDAMQEDSRVDAKTTKGAPVQLAYPVDNPVIITQPFGYNFNDADGHSHYPKYGLAGHEGIDFRAKVGDNCYAIDDGQVIFSGYDGDAYGNVIKIQHTWGISLYAHLSQFCVSDNNLPQVTKGQLIAKTGQSGDAAITGAHCHLGTKINGVKNPAFKDWIDSTLYFGATMQVIGYKLANDPTVYVQIGTTNYFVPLTDWKAFTNMGGNMQSIKIVTPDVIAKWTIVYQDYFKSK